MNNIDLSIIVPVFNVEGYLKKSPRFHTYAIVANQL